jgi:tetratricopeptide (TPR) repeat protein
MTQTNVLSLDLPRLAKPLQKLATFLNGLDRDVLAASLLVGITFALYFPLLGCDFVSYDDPLYVTDNPRVKAGLSRDGLRWALTNTDGFYHPLTWISLMLDAHLFGLRPAPFHLTNLWIHLVNAVLLYGLLRRLFDPRWQCFFIAGAFSWNPVAVESVAWIAERKGLLASFFLLSALVVYTRHGPRSGKLTRMKVLLLHGCGVLSKPTSVVLPALLVLLDCYRLRSDKVNRLTVRKIRELAWEKWPLFLVSAAMIPITCFAEGHARALQSTGGYPWCLRIANALVSCFRQVSHVFWPANLEVFYPYLDVWSTGAAGLALSAHVLMVWLGIRQWTSRPYLLFGWLWFLVTLAPMLGIIQIGHHAMADRYAYLPLTGLAIITGGLIRDLGQVEALRRRFHLLAVVPWMLLALAGMATRTQVSVWRNSFTLYTQGLRVDDRNWLCHHNLGVFYLERTNLVAAQSEFRKVLLTRPDSDEALYNLGLCAARNLKPHLARLFFADALRVDPSNPLALIGLARSESKLGHSGPALTAYEKALATNPADLVILTELSLLLARSDENGARDIPRALRLARHAYQLTGGRELQSSLALGQALAASGDAPHARQIMRNSLGIAYLSKRTDIVETIYKDLVALEKHTQSTNHVPKPL